MKLKVCDSHFLPRDMLVERYMYVVKVAGNDTGTSAHHDMVFFFFFLFFFLDLRSSNETLIFSLS